MRTHASTFRLYCYVQFKDAWLVGIGVGDEECNQILFSVTITSPV